MQLGFLPTKNAAHRLACLSLYRALLKQCAEFPRRIASSSTTGNYLSSDILRALVRYRFKYDKKFRSWPQIRAALQFGHGTLQLLEDGAAGSSRALTEMSRVLSTTSALVVRQIEASRQIRAEHDHQRLPKKIVERKAREAFLADKNNYKRRPDTVPVLQRPVPYEHALKHKDGRRRVPNYFIVQGLPFLRYTHRQPLSLSRYIEGQLTKHEKLWNAGAESGEMVKLAELEDNWDQQLWDEHRLQQIDLISFRHKQPYPWVSTYRNAWKDHQERLSRLDAKRMDYGQQLWEVHLKEAALAKVENSVRKEENRKRWQVKQIEQEEKDHMETDRVAALFGKQVVGQHEEETKTKEPNYRPFLL